MFLLALGVYLTMDRKNSIHKYVMHACTCGTYNRLIHPDPHPRSGDLLSGNGIHVAQQDQRQRE